MVNGISTALANTDLEQAFRLAHSLKSSSLAIGAYALADIAKQIEYAAKRQQIMQFDSLLNNLHEQYQQLIGKLAVL
ncbi:MAG: Hpt domain-containing protein [Moraxellaceae bacterium]|nr:Hpt domain-containing protein [Moraxellaceae bacterium]MCP5177138.1 Hpt domain-containing protein [Moraxellaceae bacterium]